MVRQHFQLLWVTVHFLSNSIASGAEKYLDSEEDSIEVPLWYLGECLIWFDSGLFMLVLFLGR